MTFSFRIRLQLANTIRITSDEPQLALAAEPFPVQLRAIGDDISLKESTSLTLSGSGYASEEFAYIAGREWMAAVQVAFAELKIGADFGYRKHGGYIGSAVKEAVRESHDVELLAEPNKLLVYRSELNPMFLSASASGHSGRRAVDVYEKVVLAKERRVTLDEQQTLAYHLFSASFFEMNPDSRLMVLMMAVETLIDETPRENAILKHIDELIKITKQSTILSSDAIKSLNSGLSQLKRQSISQAGRQLASKLQGRTYGDREVPEEFFASCYTLRSELAHGAVPRPEPVIISRRAAELQQFVGDLIRALALPANDHE